MKIINVKGDIIPSDLQEVYDFYGVSATSPASIEKAFKDAKGKDITLRINSGGGHVFAGIDIYNLIKDYKGTVNVEITGVCASIASVIAMAGTSIKMSPVGQLMIHNVSCSADGDYRDMEHMAETLKTFNEVIRNAYVLRTGKSNEELAQLMDNETWFDAKSALLNGFIDGILYDNDGKLDVGALESLRTSAVAMYNSTSKINKEMIEQYNKIKEKEVEVAKAQAKLQLLKLKLKGDVK